MDPARVAAKAAGEKLYIGRICPKGHTGPRRTSSGHCVACVSAAAKVCYGRTGREYQKTHRAKKRLENPSPGKPRLTVVLDGATIGISEATRRLGLNTTRLYNVTVKEKISYQEAVDRYVAQRSNPALRITGKQKREPKPKPPKAEPVYRRPALGTFVRNADLLREIAASKALGRVNDRLGSLLMLMARKYFTKRGFSYHTHVEDMEAEAVMRMFLAALKFDPEKSQNPFAYLTTVMTHSGYSVMRSERLHYDVLLVEFDRCRHEMELEAPGSLSRQ